MNFDKKSLAKLLALSDDELALVIKEIAAEAGVDGKSFSVSKADVAKIRTVLSLASDSDIAQLLNQFGGGLNGRKQ